MLSTPRHTEPFTSGLAIPVIDQGYRDGFRARVMAELLDAMADLQVASSHGSVMVGAGNVKLDWLFAVQSRNRYLGFWGYIWTFFRHFVVEKVPHFHVVFSDPPCYTRSYWRTNPFVLRSAIASCYMGPPIRCAAGNCRGMGWWLIDILNVWHVYCMCIGRKQ